MAEGDNSPTNSTLDSNALQALSEYKGDSKLKKEAMNILVRMLDETQLQNLMTTFEEIDTDRTGMINLNELHTAFVKTEHLP